LGAGDEYRLSLHRSLLVVGRPRPTARTRCIAAAVTRCEHYDPLSALLITPSSGQRAGTRRHQVSGL
jgi:hypothetical protein